MGDADRACRSSVLALGGRWRAVYTMYATGLSPAKHEKPMKKKPPCSGPCWVIGNGVATIAIAKSDGALDQAMIQEVIRKPNGEAPPRVLDAEPELALVTLAEN
jgi:hypothetical protein